MLALRQHPGHADLRRRRPQALGDASQAVDDRAVRAHRVGLEARIRGAEVACRETPGRRAARRSGSRARARRRPRTTTPLPGTPRNHVLQRLARPQRELALQRAHRMRGVGARELVDRALGDAEAPDLALGHELRERAEALLDRDVGIDAVQVVEVEVVERRGARAMPRSAVGSSRACRRARSCGAGSRDSRGRTWRRSAPRAGGSRSARPTSFSLWPRPYSDAVSKCVTPSSTARCSVRSETASSCGSR